MHKFLHTLLYIFVVSFSSLQLSVLLAPNAYAARTIDQMNATDQMKSYQYYHAMSACLAGAKNNVRPLLTDAVKNNQVDVGHIISPSNGKAGCINIVREAVSFWGITGSQKDILQSWGFTQNSNNQMSNQTPRSGFASNIRGLVYGNREPRLTGEMKYALYYNSLVNACGGSVAEDDDSGDRFLATKVVEGDPPQAVDRKMKVNNATAAITMGEGYPNKQRQCNTLASSMSGVAGAYAAWARDNPDLASSDAALSAAEEEQDSESTCKVDGIGWMVCPVSNFIAGLNDGLYGIIRSFLVVNTSMFDVSGDNRGTYRVWQGMRNIANAAFVIAFLFIIYSQMVGGGKR
jgi:hypothetical protein